MARRGDALREHILWAGKEVFLEFGFERASMDEVAKRAETSKRSLYAYYESKDKLFLAVIQLVRGLFLARLKLPGDYSAKPADALVMFSAHYLEALLYEPAVQMLRISASETARFPEGAAQHFEAMFGEVETRLTAYLKSTFSLPAKASSEAAQRLLGRLLFPRFQRALFGLEDLIEDFEKEGLSAKIDLRPVRKAVTELLESLPVK